MLVLRLEHSDFIPQLLNLKLVLLVEIIRIAQQLLNLLLLGRVSLFLVVLHIGDLVYLR